MTTQASTSRAHRQQIISQRSYIDHIPNVSSTVRTELTITSNKDTKNIILTSTRPIFNPTARDSDGEVLSIIPTEYSNVLLDPHTKSSAKEDAASGAKSQPTSLDESVVWIKLPHKKALEKKSHKIITLEHEYETKTTREIKFAIQPADEHPISYTFTKPDDYEFKNGVILVNGTKFSIKGDRCAKYCRIHETSKSLTITPHAGVKPMEFRCSTVPKLQIMLPPILLFLFLGISSWFMFSLTVSECGTSMLEPHFQSLLDKRIEIYLFIIAISLVLPRLVSNVYIRYQVWGTTGLVVVICVIGLLLPCNL